MQEGSVRLSRQAELNIEMDTEMMNEREREMRGEVNEGRK